MEKKIRSCTFAVIMAFIGIRNPLANIGIIPVQIAGSMEVDYENEIIVSY
jgi:hypothetical protein